MNTKEEGSQIQWRWRTLHTASTYNAAFQRPSAVLKHEGGAELHLLVPVLIISICHIACSTGVAAHWPRYSNARIWRRVILDKVTRQRTTLLVELGKQPSHMAATRFQS